MHNIYRLECIPQLCTQMELLVSSILIIYSSIKHHLSNFIYSHMLSSPVFSEEETKLGAFFLYVIWDLDKIGMYIR